MALASSLVADMGVDGTVAKDCEESAGRSTAEAFLPLRSGWQFSFEISHDGVPPHPGGGAPADMVSDYFTKVLETRIGQGYTTFENV